MIPVGNALRRCGCYVTFTRNARSNKAEGLPDFQVWYDGLTSVSGYDFTGGEGKVSGQLSMALLVK